MNRRRIGGVAVPAAIALVLALAPSALAGTIRYSVPPGPQYTVQDNGNGIVKLTYNGCVTAGARQTLSFQMTTNVTNDAPATFSVLKAEGIDPATDFSPNPVDLVQGAPQTFDITLGFTLPSANNGITTFRIKLDPASGEGLGQGAGIMVRVPCVLAAAPAPGVLAETPAPGTTAAQPGAPAVETIAVPTIGVFAVLGSSQTAGPARCVATPARLRLRAGRTTLVRVRVIATDNQGISGALVRFTLPGGRQITKRTNSLGVARLFARPTRAGTLVVQSDVCFGADRVSVIAAGVAGAGTSGSVPTRTPSFTG
ncbi:MAG TPA: hypothetical protein VMY78_07755 [Solirubrobacteraceae bacterium]|nr:hypothetical protein [Solirubrobacteraceae bacterium]